jgi:hypothetical protein
MVKDNSINRKENREFTDEFSNQVVQIYLNDKSSCINKIESSLIFCFRNAKSLKIPRNTYYY